MNVVILTTFLLCFIPALIYVMMVYWLDRYEKEPKILIGGVFLWGAIVAAGAAYVLNTVFGLGIYAFTADEALTDLATGALIAPPIEEILTGGAVLLVFLVFSKEFDSILDGIIYAGVTALGFAATENVIYLYDYGFLEDGWEGLWFMFFLRVIFFRLSLFCSAQGYVLLCLAHSIIPSLKNRTINNNMVQQYRSFSTFLKLLRNRLTVKDLLL